MSEEGGTFAERALAEMLDLLDEGALVFEGDTLACVSASARATQLLGLTREALVGRVRDEILAGIAAGDDESARALGAIRDAQGEQTARETIVIQGDPRPDGAARLPRAVVWATKPIVAFGHPIGRIDVLADRTAERSLRVELAEARARMSEMSLADEVTGLSNRKHFQSEIDREHRRSQRAWSSYAVARIDIDSMSRLNSELGRSEGDALLRRVGEALKAPRREYDLVARWEEDELIVLLPGIEKHAVKAVLGRSLASMREAARALAGREVTFCVGVALWVPPSVEMADDIVTRAGTALMAAKIMGPGTVEIDASAAPWKDDPAAAEAVAKDDPGEREVT